MFDLNDEESTRSVKDGAWDRMADAPAGGDADREHELDSHANVALFNRLNSYYQQEIDRQEDNRLQMAIDEDFHDHIQWTAEEEQELGGRGQAATVYNVVFQTVNWVTGSEKRGRTDYKVLPRGKEDAKPAERKTNLLKYFADANRTGFARSRAFEDAAKVGIGWLEDGYDDSGDGEPIYSRYESWRNMLWDSAATELDLSDCRYISRSKWIDVDIACALVPDRAAIIKTAAIKDGSNGFDFDMGDEAMDSAEQERETIASDRTNAQHGARQRVRLVEMWFRKPATKERFIKGQFRGELLDRHHLGMAIELANRPEAIASRMTMRMHVAVFCSAGLLYVGESPYRHNRFPFTPIWCYRRGRDNMPYGMIRGLRDIQVGINKRASKALYILSTNKIVMDEGAVDDVEALRDEAARPDAIIEKKQGKELVLNLEKDLAGAHLDMMSRDIAMIQQVGGVTDEQMGRTTNATSGRAIEARQDQGALSTAGLFDNLRFAYQLQGELQLALIEQYVTEEFAFRITNERGTPDYYTVNDGRPENDITRSKADFVISEGEWRATLRQAQAEQLLEMMTRLPPQVSLVMLDLVVESMDLPNREELVKRIRQITGQRDPDATELTPEEQQAQQQRAREQAKMDAMFEAELREKLAKAGKTEAEALKIAREETQNRVAKRMEAQQKAAETALKVLENPLSAEVADNILHEAGFESADEQVVREHQQRTQRAAAAAEQQAQQQQQQQQMQQAQQQQQQAPGQPPAQAPQMPPPGSSPAAMGLQ